MSGESEREDCTRCAGLGELAGGEYPCGRCSGTGVEPLPEAPAPAPEVREEWGVRYWRQDFKVRVETEAWFPTREERDRFAQWPTASVIATGHRTVSITWDTEARP